MALKLVGQTNDPTKPKGQKSGAQSDLARGLIDGLPRRGLRSVDATSGLKPTFTAQTDVQEDPLMARLRSLALSDLMLPAVQTPDTARAAYQSETYAYHRMVMVEKGRAEKIWPTLNRRREVAVVVDSRQGALALTRDLHQSGPGIRQIFFASDTRQNKWEEMLSPTMVVANPSTATGAGSGKTMPATGQQMTLPFQ